MREVTKIVATLSILHSVGFGPITGDRGGYLVFVLACEIRVCVRCKKCNY